MHRSHGAATVREGPKVNEKRKEGMYELSGGIITRTSVVVGTVMGKMAYGSAKWWKAENRVGSDLQSVRATTCQIPCNMMAGEKNDELTQQSVRRVLIGARISR